MKHLSIFLFLCSICSAQGTYITSLGIDCSGLRDNSPTWRQLVSSTGDNAEFLFPLGCIDNHASTVIVPSRAGFTLRSSQRCQNGGGNNCPTELWTGTIGGMWDFEANQAPTIEGLFFTNKTPIDYYLQFGGTPGPRISTEVLVRFNTFTNTQNNANFQAVSFVPNGNGEKNVVTDNDLFCSQSKAIRESDSAQITTGSHTLTCGLSNCSFMSDSTVGERVRVSYATGILDTFVASKTDDNHLEMVVPALSTQLNARVHFGQAYGIGIFIGSVNSKHNTLERNSFTQCACGLSVYNGSFSASHFGGYFNDTLACINDVSESSELAYLEDENALRDLYVYNIDAPLAISHARNSIYNAESDGFFYFAKGARITITSSTLQSTPQANSVLIRAVNPSTVVLLSLGNLWGPGAATVDILGFSQWKGITGISNQGALITCGDFGIVDQNGNWINPTLCGSMP